MRTDPGPLIPVDSKGVTSPFGMLRFANDYRRAANVVRSHQAEDLRTQAYMLMGHSIELSLKTYLMLRGLTIDELRRKPYGHDLANLLDKALELKIERFVPLQSFNIDAIRMISPYFANHEFRYIVTGSKTVPNWDVLSLTASMLTAGLHDIALRRRVGKAAALKRITLKGKF